MNKILVSILVSLALFSTIALANPMSQVDVVKGEAHDLEYIYPLPDIYSPDFAFVQSRVLFTQETIKTITIGGQVYHTQSGSVQTNYDSDFDIIIEEPSAFFGVCGTLTPIITTDPITVFGINHAWTTNRFSKNCENSIFGWITGDDNTGVVVSGINFEGLVNVYYVK